MSNGEQLIIASLGAKFARSAQISSATAVRSSSVRAVANVNLSDTSAEDAIWIMTVSPGRVSGISTRPSGPTVN